MSTEKRIEFRAWRGPTAKSEEEQKKRAKKLGKRARARLGSHDEPDPDVSMVYHLNRWATDEEGHWHHEKYLGEFISLESLRKIYTPFHLSV